MSRALRWLYSLAPVQWYVESFRELRAFPDVKDAAGEEDFTRLIRAIMTARLTADSLLSKSLSHFSFAFFSFHLVQRHNNVVPMIARGVHELRTDQGADLQALPEIHQFLDGFYMSRASHPSSFPTIAGLCSPDWHRAHRPLPAAQASASAC